MDVFSRDFTEGNIKKNLISLSVPILVTYMFNILYNIVDSLWIGNILGESAIAALTVSSPLILIFMSVGMGATNGLSILLSRSIGAKDKEGITKIISTSFLAALGFSLFLTVVCEFSTNFILGILNTPEEIFIMAKEYLSIYILGFLFVFMYLYFTAVLRSFGNSLMQMLSIISCTILNAILDPLFIRWMGIKGAAVATLISQGIMIMILIFYIQKKKLVEIHLKSFDKDILKEIVKNAAPSIIQQSLPALSTSFITSIVSTFGVLPIAAFGICGKLETVLLYPAMALNISLTTCTGQCYGAKKESKAKEYLNMSILFGGIILLVLTGMMVLFSVNLAGLFGAGVQSGQLVQTYFKIISIGYSCNTITNCILGTINGYGKPISAMFLMIFYYMIVRMPLVKLLSLTSIELNGIWIAVLISHIAAAIASFVYFRTLVGKEREGVELYE